MKTKANKTQVKWTGADREAAQLQGWDIFRWNDPVMYLANTLDDPHGVAESYGVKYAGPDFGDDHEREEKLERYLRNKVRAGDKLAKKALAVLRQKRSPQVERLSV
jgi:hypothetical protein